MESQLIFIFSLLGSALGAASMWFYQKTTLGNCKSLAAEIIHKGELEVESMKQSCELALKQNKLDQQRELEQVWQIERKKIQKEDERLKQREDKLESRMNLVEKKLSDIEKREAILIGRRVQLEDEKKKK